MGCDTLLHFLHRRGANKPVGRHLCCLDRCPLTRGTDPFRACDRLLHQVGISPLPLTWPSMAQLHERARHLCGYLPHMPFHETFPWAVYRWIQQGRKKSMKRKDPSLLAEWARQKGFSCQPTSVHEWDTLACWAMGWLAHQGEAQALTTADGAIWVPTALLTSRDTLS